MGDKIGWWSDGSVGASGNWVRGALPGIVRVCEAEVGDDSVVLLFGVRVAVGGLALGVALVVLRIVVVGVAGVVCGGCRFL